MNNYYKDEFLPKIVRIGKWTNWVAVLWVMVPAITVTFFFGIVPGKTQLMTALAAQISVNAVWWFIEPVSFFQVLGVPGTYMAFLTGNVSNLRLPCAAAALKATNTIIGTEKGTIISTIGVSASVFMNTTLLAICVVAGSHIMNMLPDAIVTKLTLLLPALFGAIFAQFAVDDVKSAICGMGLAIGSLLLYTKGLLNWFPIDPFIPAIIIPIFGTMIFTRIMFNKRKEV